MGSPTEPVMRAVLTSIPLCSRAKEAGGETPDTDRRPEDRQTAGAVVAQPLSVQLQSNTSETCIDNENHQDQEITEETEPAQTVDQLQTSTEEAASQELQPEDDGNVEVSLDDSQSDEWSLEKEVEGQSDSQEEEVEEDQEHFRKTSPELDTAAAITNILTEIVGG